MNVEVLTTNPGNASTVSTTAPDADRPRKERAKEVDRDQPNGGGDRHRQPVVLHVWVPSPSTKGAAQRIWPTRLIAPEPTRE